VTRKLMVISAGLLAILIFALGVFYYSGQKTQKITHVVQDNREALIRDHSPVYGNPNAKVTIVEFFDPACEACRAFYPFVKTLVNASFGRVNLVVRYAAFHKGSDEAVKILEAAKLQKVYWPVLEAMLASQPVWASHERPQPGLIWDYIKETGIDIAKAKADMNDPQTVKILKQDMADGVTLKVTGTPSFFVNGKPLIDFGPDQLKNLVDKETRSAYGK
jgi:protein-disulfide isomerase